MATLIRHPMKPPRIHTADQMRLTAENRRVHEIAARLLEIRVEPLEGRWFWVVPVWADVDRPDIIGFHVRTRALVNRLTRAIGDGVLYEEKPFVTRDDSGRTYVRVSYLINPRCLNYSLRLLGY